MLNDVKIPPRIDPNDPAGPAAPVLPVMREVDPNHRPKEPGVRPHEHVQPHLDLNTPGIHKPRLMGEPTTTDVIYAMPMEDRGSFFSLALSAVVVAVVGLLLLTLWLSFR
jgi:hypothetical protein